MAKNKTKNAGVVGNAHINNQNNYFGVKATETPNNIPPPIDNFVGREEYLAPLREDYKNGKRCFVLHGIGGVGKTELAKRFAKEIEGNFKARIFVDMMGMSENPHSAETAMAAIIRMFAPELSADLSHEQIRGIFTQFVQGQKTLIVLDNADNKKAVEELKQADACLIVTSREAFTLTNKEGSRRIGQMSAEDARELIYEIAGKDSLTNEQADELANLAGYLPMALRSVAALLAEDEFETAGNLINRYSDKQKLLETKVPDYDDRTIAASFELSYGILSEEMQSHWLRLSVFPADFDEKAMAHVLNISDDVEKETQKHLRRLNLLEGNSETHRFSLHDLIREFTAAKFSKEELFQTQLLFAKYYASILISVDRMQNNKEENYYIRALNLIDSEWTNILAGQRWAAEFIESDEQVADLCTDYSGYGRDFIVLRLHQRQNIEWLEIGLKAARKLNDRQGEGNSLGNLGLAYKNLGEYRKAIEYQEQYLAISREIGDRQGEGNSLGSLGNAYDSLGEYRKAIEYHEQHLSISREIGDRQGEGNSLGSLGIAYSSLGEYRKAIEYHEQYLSISREIADRQGEGNSLGNLGIAYDSLGEYRKAIEYHEQSLAIARDIGDREGEGISLGSLGTTYYGLGKKEKACQLWREALAIYEAIESPHANWARQQIEKYCH